MSWSLPMILGLLVPLVGQLAAFLVVRPGRVGKDRLLVWVPVAGMLLLATQRSIARRRRVAAVAVAAAGSYLVVALLALIGLLAGGEVTALRPEVTAVVPGSPAAGVLEPGDRIERAAGVPLEPGRPSLAAHVADAADRPLALVIVRGGEPRTIVVNGARDEEGHYRIGVQLEYVELRSRPPLGRAIGSALAAPARKLQVIAESLWGIASGTEETTFTGPVGVAGVGPGVRPSPARSFAAVLLLAIYGLVFVITLDLVLALVALFTRDEVAA